MRFEHAFESELWLYQSDKAAWHFLSLPKDASADIRMLSKGMTNGFGSLRVAARIGEVRWTTSIFPNAESKSYMLPVKADVRKKAGIAAGDSVSVIVEFGI